MNLVIASDTYRSQGDNRQACLDKLGRLIVRAMTQPKKRIPTKPTAGARQRRLDAKKHRSKTKTTRREPFDT